MRQSSKNNGAGKYSSTQKTGRYKNGTIEAGANYRQNRHGEPDKGHSKSKTLIQKKQVTFNQQRLSSQQDNYSDEVIDDRYSSIRPSQSSNKKSDSIIKISIVQNANADLIDTINSINSSKKVQKDLMATNSTNKNKKKENRVNQVQINKKIAGSVSSDAVTTLNKTGSVKGALINSKDLDSVATFKESIKSITVGENMMDQSIVYEINMEPKSQRYDFHLGYDEPTGLNDDKLNDVDYLIDQKKRFRAKNMMKRLTQIKQIEKSSLSIQQTNIAEDLQAEPQQMSTIKSIEEKLPTSIPQIDLSEPKANQKHSDQEIIIKEEQSVSILKSPKLNFTFKGDNTIEKMPIKKTVSINENKNKQVVNNNNSDNTYHFSVSSHDEKLGYDRSFTLAQDKNSDNHSIISEKESAFEEATPAANRVKRTNQITDFSKQMDTFQDKMELYNKKRDFIKTKKSLSITNQEDQIIDNRKAKPVRMQTMQKQQEKRQISPAGKSKGSKGRLIYHDQESMRSVKFNNQRNRGINDYRNTFHKRDSINGGNSAIKTDQSNIQQHAFKKQTTQDEKRRGRFGKSNINDDKDSRNNSLNLTVDNQLDMLSVSYKDQQMFGFNRKNGKKDSHQRGTFSMTSGYNLKEHEDNKILAKSKSKQDPRSSLRFQRQNSNDSKFQRNSNCKRQNVQLSQNSHSRSPSIGWEKYRQFAKQNGLPCEEEEAHFEVLSYRKAEDDIKSIYMKPPYKVMNIKQVKKNHQQSISANKQKEKLFQADNNLKVQTGYNILKHAQIDGGQEQMIKKVILNDTSEDIIRSGQLRVQESNTDLYNSHLYVPQMIKNADDQKEYLNQINKSVNSFETSEEQRQEIRHTNQTPIVSQNTKNEFSSHTDFIQEETSTVITPIKQYQQNYNLNFANKQVFVQQSKQIVSSGRTFKSEKQKQQQDFKMKFYEQLISQLDRQLENTNNFVLQIKKQKDLCNIYGQTFQPILFGDTSYTPITHPFITQTQTPRELKNKKYLQKPLNHDILQPLSQKLKINQTNKDQSKPQYSLPNHIVDTKETKYQNDDEFTRVEDIDILDSDKLKEATQIFVSTFPQKIDFTELILAESGIVKKDIVLSKESVLHPMMIIDKSKNSMSSIKQNDIGVYDLARDSFLIDENSYEKIKKNLEQANSIDSGFARSFSPLSSYHLMQLSSVEQLKAILDLSRTMDYSHQQLRLLQQKQNLIQDAESSLDHLLKQIKRRESYVNKPKSQVKYPYRKQKTDISTSKKERDGDMFNNNNMLTFDPQPNAKQQFQALMNKEYVKSYYPEVAEISAKQLVKLNINGEPHSKLDNKMNYQQKIETLRNINSNSKGQQNYNTQDIRSRKMANNSTFIQSTGSKKNTQRSSNIGNVNSQFQTGSTNLNNDDPKQFEDYYGNKINLRRSIEQMFYETRQFKKNVVKYKNEIFGVGVRDTQLQLSAGNQNAAKVYIKNQNTKKKMNYNTTSMDKPLNDYISKNKRNLLGFQMEPAPQIEQQLPEIIAQSKEKQNKGQVINPFSQTQKLRDDDVDITNLHIITESSHLEKYSGISKFKATQDLDKDKTPRNDRNKGGFNFSQTTPSEVLGSNQKYSQAYNQDNLETSPQIHKNRSKIIQDYKNSKTNLKQNGANIMNQNGVRYSSQIQGSNPNLNSGRQLAYQFKNISPRMPNLTNNLMNPRKSNNDDLEMSNNRSSLIKMQNYQNSSPSKDLSSTQISMLQTDQNNMMGIAKIIGVAENYGSTIKNNQVSKQTQILKGVLNQQRRLNRILQNNGLLGLQTSKANIKAVQIRNGMFQQLENHAGAQNQRNNNDHLRQAHNTSQSQNSSLITDIVVPHGRSIINDTPLSGASAHRRNLSQIKQKDNFAGVAATNHSNENNQNGGILLQSGSTNLFNNPLNLARVPQDHEGNNEQKITNRNLNAPGV